MITYNCKQFNVSTYICFTNQLKLNKMKIINKITGYVIDTGLDDFNAGILINEYQNDDYIIVEEENERLTDEV